MGVRTINKIFLTIVFILFLINCATLQLIGCTSKRKSPFPIIPKKQDSGVVYNNKLKSYPAEYFIVQNYIHSSQCEIYTGLGQFVKNFPQDFCHFTSDGYYIGMASSNLYFYNQKMENIWKLKFDRTHHDLYVDESRKEIAVVQSKFQQTEKGLIENHGITVIDYNGKIVFEWNSLEHIKELEKIYGKKFTSSKYRGRKYFIKINSVQIIPENKFVEKSTIFKAGNLLINFRDKPFSIILQRNNNKILWSYIFSEKLYKSAHSPRILKNGNMIYFRNHLNSVATDSDVDILKENKFVIENPLDLNSFLILQMHDDDPMLTTLDRSQLEIIDPLTKSLKWSYSTPLSSVSFFSPSFGHVQYLENGNILVTHVTHGGSAFEITGGGEIVWEWVNEKKWPNGRPLEIYRVIKIKKDIIQPFLDQTF